jgi:hypothetical protein
MPTSRFFLRLSGSVQLTVVLYQKSRSRPTRRHVGGTGFRRGVYRPNDGFISTTVRAGSAEVTTGVTTGTTSRSQHHNTRLSGKSAAAKAAWTWQPRRQARPTSPATCYDKVSARSARDQSRIARCIRSRTTGGTLRVSIPVAITSPVRAQKRLPAFARDNARLHTTTKSQTTRGILQWQEWRLVLEP